MKTAPCVALALLLPVVAHAAQQGSQAIALPDSSYLFLTLELPVNGTFNTTRVQLLRQGELRRNVLHEIRDVDVQACVMSYSTRARSFDEFTRAPSSAYTVTQVPLKEIDQARVLVRPAFPMNARYDPPAFEVVGYALQRGARPIKMRNTESGTQSREYTFRILVNEVQQARRLASALVDAAKRCDSWRTDPLPVIRSP